MAQDKIKNADINASAAIDASKIANGTVSNTEFQYLDGVTSSIQTQLNSKASQDTMLACATIGTTIAASTTVYSAINSSSTSTENTRQSAITFNCTLSGMTVVTGSSQSGTGSLVFTARFNAVAQSTVVTVAAGSAAGVFSTTTTSSYTALQKISIEVKNNATASSATIATIGSEWTR